jgi:hypothetical protein
MGSALPRNSWQDVATTIASQFTVLQAPCADFEHDSDHLDITQSHPPSIFIWASRGKNLPTTDSRLRPGEDGVVAGKSLRNVGIRRARSQPKRRSLPDTGSLSHLDLAISFRAQGTNHASDVYPSQLFRLPCHQIMLCACSASRIGWISGSSCRRPRNRQPYQSTNDALSRTRPPEALSNSAPLMSLALSLHAPL